uniref:Protein kinase domain-containing protein n=1 Tax=Chromera velia CCMP2878 TaxID=1169474 RepID=A0A0G4I6X2_9ALVE|eukprot:Cvel_11527.t1-p1 / transcript=Cvel_11527.t1 / gene=Cvel_11527 / organism=Chromera_velia_CCMP2878 / gene_product=hypothetical protein / transcript_product=hypothetical protein / location=Cvel_scaffold727:27292-30389(-) / protein_length=797 / sequence_SO=supercontig / SO=protein_coding / is_pseudo=false
MVSLILSAAVLLLCSVCCFSVEAAPGSLPEIVPLSAPKQATFLSEDIQPFVAKQYEFFARQGLSSSQIKEAIEQKYSTNVPEGLDPKKFGFGLRCLSLPPTPKTIEVESIDQCHPGLKELKQLGRGLFGTVTSVSVDGYATEEDKKRAGEIYSGLRADQTYALKQMFSSRWRSTDGLVSFPVEMSEVGIKSEMCIAKEAGEAGVGAVMYGSWFCRVRKTKMEHAFLLMEQLGKTLSSAFLEAKTENLIISPDAQRATLGIHENFYQLGYFHDDFHMGNHAFDSAGRVRLLDFGYVSPWWKGPCRGSKKEDQLLGVGQQLHQSMLATFYFMSYKNQQDDVVEKVEDEIEKGKYNWGSMTEYTERKVYPLPKNTESREELVITSQATNRKAEGEGTEKGEEQGVVPLRAPRQGSLFSEDIKPFVAKQYEFFAKEGLSPPEVEKAIQQKYSAEGMGLPCLWSPPMPSVVEVDTLADCHPGLKEIEKLGSGMFGQVVSVGIDEQASDEDRRKVILGGGLYTPLDPGRTYALKQMAAGSWTSSDGQVSFPAAASEWGIKSEMCVAGEAGKGGVGPEVHGTWFCRVRKLPDTMGSEEPAKLQYGFILMERLHSTVKNTFIEASKKNLIITPNAQRATMGIHERFYDLGYFHDDAHLNNHAFDAEGRVRLLDFGFVRSWLFPPGGNKKRQIAFVASQIEERMMYTKYFFGKKHADENIAKQVMSQIYGPDPWKKSEAVEWVPSINRYKWGSMGPYTDKVVYPLPPNETEATETEEGDEAQSDTISEFLAGRQIGREKAPVLLNM